MFGSVTESSGTITCKDSSNNTLLTLVKSGGGTSFTVTAYASASLSNATTWSYGTSSSQVVLTYAYSCANGVMIRFDGSQYAATVLIAKANTTGKLIIAYPSSLNTPANVYKTFYSVSWGDVAPLSTFSISTNSRNQDAVFPFVSCCDTGAQSYTPDAGAILSGQYYGMGFGKIILDDNVWLTNGYWCIRDGAAA